MKKLFLLSFAITLLFAACAFAQADTREVITSGYYEYIVLEDGTAEITKYTGYDRELEVPSQLDGINVTAIGDFAFRECQIASIALPAGLRSIGANPFLYSWLSEINLSADNPCFELSDGALISLSDRRLVCYIGSSSVTEYAVPQGITALGDYAFAGCALHSITLPESLQTVGTASFLNCDGLMEINVSPDNRSFRMIDGSLVSLSDARLVCHINDTEQTDYSVPQGIRIIGDYAFHHSFYGCDSLRSITIPDGVLSIGAYAFCGCDGLERISVPETVAFVGEYAFWWCENLREISLPDSIPSINAGTFYGCSSLLKVSFPGQLLSIGEDAFVDCVSLREMSFPDSLVSIGDHAFWGCSALDDLFFPDLVLSVGNWAFSSCSNLTHVTIMSSVQAIGEGAFDYCSEKLTITVEQGSYAQQWCIDNGFACTYE